MVTDPAIIEELKRIADTNGGLLTPDRVVNAARRPSSPIHDWFEWDDSAAAERYRLWQARTLLRVTATYIEKDGARVAMRVFVSLKPDRMEKGGGYRATAQVLSSASMRRQFLEDALADLDSFKRKYNKLNELASVFAAMRVAERKLLNEIGHLGRTA